MSSFVPAANKDLGQHYLHDKQILGRIASACGPLEGHTVLEIGPGPGALTTALLMGGAHVVAIEKDARFVPILEELSAAHDNRLTVHHEDALKINYPDYVPAGSTLAGNLPYNVGTEIVMRAIQGDRCHFDKMVFLLQKEVIQRICATAGHEHWGRLGVWCDLLTERHSLFDVAPGAFNPPPKVMSRVASLTPRAKLQVEVDQAKLAKLLQQTFTQRRKMLRRSLKGWLTEEQLTQAGVKPSQRPEELNTAQLCALANQLK